MITAPRRGLQWCRHFLRVWTWSGGGGEGLDYFVAMLVIRKRDGKTKIMWVTPLVQILLLLTINTIIEVWIVPGQHNVC